MSDLRADEEWARHVIAQHLAVNVIQHDDGSHEAMHDLDIVYADCTTCPVEVTTATDGEVTALWKLMNESGGRWIAPDLVGGWMLSLWPHARAKRLRAEGPGLLAQLEREGVKEIAPRRTRNGHPLVELARELGIGWARQSGTDYPGSIYVTVDLPMDRSGGMVAETGDALAAWVACYIADERRVDVVEKLRRVDAREAHVFLILPGFADAPFAVTDLLMRYEAPLPIAEPLLPWHITDVWVMSTWMSGTGMRWSRGAGWSSFDKGINVEEVLEPTSVA